jgi:hypothetical protein
MPETPPDVFWKPWKRFGSGWNPKKYIIDIEEGQDTFNKEAIYYTTYEGDKPLELTEKYILNIEEDINGRAANGAEYLGTREALAYIIMVASRITHKQRIVLLETFTKQLKSYLSEYKRPLGKIEKMVKASMDEALDREQKREVIQIMGQEFKRSQSDLDLIERKIHYGHMELCKTMGDEKAKIDLRVLGKDGEGEMTAP